MSEDINSIIATDCCSTTTKAILIKKDEKGEYRLKVRGEAPTTVESPFEDVTRGVLNAIREVEELSGDKILDGEKIIHPNKGNEGVDLYLSTSSAGGGLQMMVSGVVMEMTAESAERAALGAGSIVMDVIASNDGRLSHEQIERIRHLRPDMILLAGGTDEGTVSHVVELAQVIAAADPKPRLGIGYKLPVIYAGNIKARDEVSKLLKDKTDLFIVDNLRPTLESENLGPARDKIHDLFMEHVMQQAPGYDKLIKWTDAKIMPTPAAVGLLIETIAKQQEIQVVGVDIGGATTDVFSVFKEKEEPKFNRTVSANLGMSYSISNVLAEAGIENIMRWVPYQLPELEVRNRIKNKMIRPTTVPQSLDDLKLEQAVAREALRLAFVQHKDFAVSLKGIQQQRTISDSFDQKSSGLSLVNMMDLDLLVGSGGVLSHAPRRSQAALMMIDAFQPEGYTKLAVDSIFMMPQLGVLSTIHEKAATEVFEKDCLIHLGGLIAPVGEGKEGQSCVKIEGNLPSGSINEQIAYGEMKVYPLGLGETANIKITPGKGFDAGAGVGKPYETSFSGGVVGLMIDARGRPLELPKEESARVKKLEKWANAFDAYPK